ncbi:WXG100 family type VII secretion target [Nocardia sp. NBC_01388]|uniref:WXG100 family type VII secretion target n=1 Tax=Nocardia sp. NBC_01388 TaxID=2903596 RepID=UPI00324A4B88
MADEVHAKLSDLRSSANQLTTWANESAGLFGQGHTEMDDAGAGWVGGSAAALSAAVERLRTSANALTGNLDNHSAHIHTVANELHLTDAERRNQLSRYSEALGPSSLDL